MSATALPLEPEALRSCLGDLVSLLSLPSLSQGRPLRSILDLTLEALGAIIPFDVGYARLAAEGIDAIRCADLHSLEEMDRLREALRPHLRMPPPPPGTVLEGLPRLAKVSAVFLAVGFYADAGMLVLGARRPGFPSQRELLLARAAASLLSSTVEHARAQAWTEQARRAAEAANRAKDEFLAMLGHELRNPLAPIVTALELMKLRAGDSVRRERQIIERQVLHLRKLVDDLLDVSRIARGLIELSRQRIELCDVVHKALEVVSPLLEQRRHHLTLECPRSGLLVEVDPVRCTQIVANLVTNAAKYTDPGGLISVRAEREGPQAVIRVRDSGIGMAADVLPVIFDLFVQEGRAIDRAQGGLGLGLAIVRSLVTLHGGTVTAHSEGRGRGSEFTVRLPLAVPEARPAPAVAASPGAAERSGRRVLVVDDNEDAARTLGELLSAWGYTAKVVTDAPQALLVAGHFLPDVALLDIGLPVMDGYELAMRLREIPALQGTRIAAVTGYGQEDDRRRAARAGIDAHLVKPVDPERLRETLDRLLAEAPLGA